MKVRAVGPRSSQAGAPLIASSGHVAYGDPDDSTDGTGDSALLTHELPGYRCPFCQFLAGAATALNAPSDIVRRNHAALAFISPRWWPNNPGHVIVIPTAHHENLYDLPPAYGHAVHDLTRDIAIALRAAYGCDGTSTRQHNESAGDQDVWHHHVHVFPRYHGDDLYTTLPNQEFASIEQRTPYAEKLRSYFG